MKVIKILVTWVKYLSCIELVWNTLQNNCLRQIYFFTAVFLLLFFSALSRENIASGEGRLMTFLQLTPNNITYHVL